MRGFFGIETDSLELVCNVSHLCHGQAGREVRRAWWVGGGWWMARQRTGDLGPYPTHCGFVMKRPRVRVPGGDVASHPRAGSDWTLEVRQSRTTAHLTSNGEVGDQCGCEGGLDLHEVALEELFQLPLGCRVGEVADVQAAALGGTGMDGIFGLVLAGEGGVAHGVGNVGDGIGGSVSNLLHSAGHLVWCLVVLAG